MINDDGDPAFPSEQGRTSDGLWNQTYNSGMTLRDWFAGQALMGLATLMAHPKAPGEEGQAIVAYKLADAMLRERNK
jgi:hypothetical protein